MRRVVSAGRGVERVPQRRGALRRPRQPPTLAGRLQRQLPAAHQLSCLIAAIPQQAKPASQRQQLILTALRYYVRSRI